MPLLCQPNLLSGYLTNQLTPDEAEFVEGHLDDCGVCREEIERLAATKPWWNEARDFLSSDERLLAEAPLAEPLPEAIRRDLAVRYLAPSDDPRFIGRIGPYEVVGVIGSGGMGVVFKGFDAALNRNVAIKVVAPHLAGSAAARQRFTREARAAAAVVHDNVLAIHGVAEHLDLPYLVMPYLRGPSLQKRLDDHGPLTTTEILRIAMQTAAGLAAAHAQGLVHRDIKPANILLEEGIERVRISDFGLARAADDASLTHTGIIPGTPHYMSPEQARGRQIDHRSDLFSLGGVMYAMATGRPPFRAETSYGVLREVEDATPRSIHDQNPNIPVWLEAIIFKLLAKNAADRFGSATEVANELERRLAERQAMPQATLPKSLLLRSRLERWLLAGAIAMGVIGVITASVIALNQPRSNSKSNSTATVGPHENSPTHSPAPTDDQPSASSTTAATQNTNWDSGLEAELQFLRQEMSNLEVIQQSSWPSYSSSSEK